MNDFEDGKCNCSNSGGSFSISDGRFQTIIDEPDATFTGSPSYHSPPLPQTTTGSATSTSMSSSGASNTISGQSTSSSTSTPSHINQPSPTNQPSNTTSSIGLKIGLGIGVPIFFLLAALSVWCLFRRRQSAPHPPVFRVPDPDIPLQAPVFNPYDPRPDDVAQYEDSSEGAKGESRIQFSNTPPPDNPYDR